MFAPDLFERQFLRRFVIDVGDFVPVVNRNFRLVLLQVQHPSFGDASELDETGVIFRDRIAAAQSIYQTREPILLETHGRCFGLRVQGGVE